MQVQLFTRVRFYRLRSQTADDGEGYGDYIPDEDYVEESDPGDTYYWYDGEGNVMYFDGSDSYYIGPDDVFYIDEAGS